MSEETLESAANDYADKHGFRVPYDGTNKFYDDNDVKWSKEGFIAGAKWQSKQIPTPPPPTDEEIEKMAEAHADKYSYKSDKQQFTITPWIQHSWAKSNFKKGYKAALNKTK